jgi:hypothetical protein
MDAHLKLREYPYSYTHRVLRYMISFFWLLQLFIFWRHTKIDFFKMFIIQDSIFYRVPSVKFWRQFWNTMYKLSRKMCLETNIIEVTTHHV